MSGQGKKDNNISDSVYTHVMFIMKCQSWHYADTLRFGKVIYSQTHYLIQSP